VILGKIGFFNFVAKEKKSAVITKKNADMTKKKATAKKATTKKVPTKKAWHEEDEVI